MITAVIIIIALFLLITLVRAIINEDDNDIRILPIISALIVLVVAYAAVCSINSDTKEYTSKTKVTPTVEVNITKLDSLVIKSDTTYIYTFRE